ncbi:MAG: acyl-CoA dehydrogenase domain protein [Acidimicrobiales bacterium]|nr:acyl-CoA dehydrogenase domain protein [Acidimicrobiales bacterium]
MNFELDETQQAMSDLSRQVLADHGGHDRARELERGEGVDRAAWEALGTTGLLAAVAGGEGGVVGAAQVAMEIGRHVVTVPAFALLTALITLGERTSELELDRLARLLAGTELITLGLHEVGSPEATQPATTVDEGRLTGTKPAVPVLAESDAALVSARGNNGPGLYLVETSAPGVTHQGVHTTDRGSAGHLQLGGVAARVVGDAASVARAEQVATVLVCATLVGIGRAAAEGAAAYVTDRHQFGRPIASFQAPVLRLADAHIDLEAMHVTMLQAAWQLDHEPDASAAVSVAKWWSAEGGHRTLHTAQHLHGGIGSDIEYPAHRYFLRGKQLVDTLGGAAVHARRLGAVLAAEATR